MSITFSTSKVKGLVTKIVLRIALIFIWDYITKGEEKVGTKARHVSSITNFLRLRVKKDFFLSIVIFFGDRRNKYAL